MKQINTVTTTTKLQRKLNLGNIKTIFHILNSINRINKVYTGTKIMNELKKKYTLSANISL